MTAVLQTVRYNASNVQYHLTSKPAFERMSRTALSLFFPLLISLFPCLSASGAIAHPIKSCPASGFSPRRVSTKEEAQLKVLVPNIPAESLREFVNCSDPSRVSGFCIDVFETALSILEPPSLSSTTIHYTCFNFSASSYNSNSTLDYDHMVKGVANGYYDAVVGDVTISSGRAFNVDFTHGYMESGIVIIAKAAHQNHVAYKWNFFGLPFTLRMWCTILGTFIFTGFLLWLFEYEYHQEQEFTETSFPRRGYEIFWFVMETLILLKKDNIKSTIAKLVIVAWLFVAILGASSYTAGLSSFLTASALSSKSYDIHSLKDTNNKSIAIRRGSIVEGYLLTRFHFPKDRFKYIRATRDFVDNLTKGEVVAIVDERPYANFILQNISCEYTIVGQQLTHEGFGF
ncbi:hypothetical protein GOP47_0008777, partial [Adiantum capillus-veneris]